MPKKKETDEPKEEKKETTSKKTTTKEKTTKKSVKDEALALIKSMSVVELYELVKELEEEFQVTASAPVITQVVAGEEAPKEEIKITFNTVLASVGDQKLQVIKVIRQLTKLGLREAKELVDTAPSTIKEDVSKEEAEEIKTKLEEVGATVELK